jgi:ubiquinone biosynthesis monooxygenase Coq6
MHNPRQFSVAILRRAFSTTVQPQKRRELYDVAIIGGGPVGNAMACSLGHSKLLNDKRVLLLEASQPTRLGSPPEKYSNKVFACGPAAIQMFKDLGIWQTLVNYRVKEVAGLYVLDACSRSKVQFYPQLGVEAVSHLIEDGAITKALYGRTADNCPNVEIRTGVKVENCRIPNSLSEPATLKLSNGEEINALLVIGADGNKSIVRQAMGVQTTRWDYDQMAIVCTLSVDLIGENTIAWQRFTPLGPIALLPVTDKLSSLVWTSKTEDARRLMALPPDQFVDELNHYLFTNAAQDPIANQALGIMDQVAKCLRFTDTPESIKQLPTVLQIQHDSRAAYPLGFNHASTYVKTRSALIGDAAHRIHPLAGQGVNLGWSDVRFLTASLEKACKEGADLGSLTYLSDYDSQSHKHNVPVMIAVDWLNRLYRTSFAPLVFLRSIGLHAVDKITPIKDLIVSRASG